MTRGTVTIIIADDPLTALEELAASEGVSVSRLVATLADDAADQARKLRAIRRDLTDADLLPDAYRAELPDKANQYRAALDR